MKKNILTIMGLLCAMGAAATPLSPGEALGRALADNNARRAGAMLYAPKATDFSLSRTVEADGEAAVYLFGDRAGRFMLVSADDCAPALLGYGDQSAATASENAPGFEYWMGEMARQIAWNRDNGGYCPAPAADHEPIEPMCATRWSQSEPYNQKCPPRNSADKAVTGCVATAMAQVMKYHNWPDPAGENKITYQSKNYGELRVNFANTPLDWANMRDTYRDGDWTTAEATAVATLMMCAGYAVQMNYSTSASGAVSMRIAPALGTYFKYDRRLTYSMRDYYSAEEWDSMVYGALSTYGPVVYDGQSEEGGHSFVCDGYSGDGYYHINWGWNGMSDGYFLLSVLDPGEQGTGGGIGAFKYDQDAILNIRPAEEGNPDAFTSTLVCTQGFEPYVENGDIDEYRGLGTRGFIYNIGPADIEESDDNLLRLLLKPVDGGETLYSEAAFGALPMMYGFEDPGLVIGQAVPDGKYVCEIEYSLAGGPWQLPLFPYGQPNSGYVTFANGVPVSMTSAPVGAGVGTLTEAPTEGTQYWSVDGRALTAPAESGLYIERRNGKTTLRMAR